MNYKCKIKLSGVNNLDDARFAAAAGFDYIGFCFDSSNPHYIPPIKAKEIIDWTTGSFIVGEFGNQTIEEIKDITELLQLDVVEIKNTESKISHLPVIINVEEILPESINTIANNIPLSIPLHLLKHFNAEHDLILRIENQPPNEILSLIQDFAPIGIDFLNTTTGSKDDLRDLDAIADTLDLLSIN